MGQAVRRRRRAGDRRGRPRDATGPIIVIAQNSREAEALSEEIRFFAGPSLPCTVFPDLETLPYDGFSAHPDITSARLATLAELPRARHGVWLVAIDTLLQRLAPRSYIEAYSLKVHVNETLDLEALRAQFALAGYAAVTQVVAHGEFAVRGSLHRCISHGLGDALSDRHAGSGRRQHPPLRSRTPSARSTSWTASICCRRAKRR